MTTSPLAPIDLIHAHQTMLAYVIDHGIADNPRAVLDYLNVGPSHYDAHARGMIVAIARRLNRRITASDANAIACYVRN